MMKHASRLQQVRIYTGKCMRAFVNEKGWKNLISTLIIVVLIVMVVPDDMFFEYGPTRNGCFALICACVWIGVFNSIQSICRERDIIKREHRSGLHMTSYVAAHMIYEMMISLVEAVIVTAVFLMGVEHYVYSTVSGMPLFGEFLITFFLLIYSSDVLGIMVSSIVKTPNSAMTVMPFVLIIELIMCGYIFELDGFTDMISNLTVSKWAMYAMGTITNVNAMENYIPKFVSNYLYTSEHLFAMWGILALYAFIYGVIAVIALEFVDLDKR